MLALTQLKSSIKGLYQQFGQADPSTATIINLTIALPGLLLVVYASQPVQIIGWLWILLNLYPVIQLALEKTQEVAR